MQTKAGSAYCGRPHETRHRQADTGIDPTVAMDIQYKHYRLLARHGVCRLNCVIHV